VVLMCSRYKKGRTIKVLSIISVQNVGVIALKKKVLMVSALIVQITKSLKSNA